MKRYSIAFLCFSILASASSCLKDRNIDNQQYGMAGTEDIRLVEFSTGEIVTGVNAGVADTTVHLVTVHLNSALPATEDIKVTLQRNDGRVTDAGYVLLPADRYILADLTVTIPKGSRDGYLDITVNPNDLLDDYYAFSFDIVTAPPGVSISRNFSGVLSELIVLNQWDGIYQVRGVLTNHPTVSGPFNKEVEVFTSSINSVQFRQVYHSGAFSVYPNVNIDAQNRITFTGSTPDCYIPAGADNYYDPATRTFYLDFSWSGSPSDRRVTDTLVYLRPRF